MQPGILHLLCQRQRLERFRQGSEMFSLGNLKMWAIFVTWVISHTLNILIALIHSSKSRHMYVSQFIQYQQYQQYQQNIIILTTQAHPWAPYLPAWVSRRPWNPWSNPTRHRPFLLLTSRPWMIPAGKWDVLPWQFKNVSNLCYMGHITNSKF